MPSLTLRGRYLMREYWADSELFLKLTPEVREMYQGLWMLADDEGYMPRDIAEIGASLYRFEDRGPREARIRAGLDRLRALGKVESHRCGCLFIPAVVRYPRSGRKTTEWFERHQKHSNGIRTPSAKDIRTDSNPSPVPSLPDVVPSGARENAKDEYGAVVAAKLAQKLGFREP